MPDATSLADKKPVLKKWRNEEFLMGNDSSQSISHQQVINTAPQHPLRDTHRKRRI